MFLNSPLFNNFIILTSAGILLIRLLSVLTLLPGITRRLSSVLMFLLLTTVLPARPDVLSNIVL